eukprot:comp58752_c0_seq1/m.47827 comp58752_c0_seq1/g.47827  ORF comp58752_c0_seq1/g.47827 comp58752_c0_seq1/m.47827 type:complete len:192 (-) comp58752_c0_seq1:197-772(-)
MGKIRHERQKFHGKATQLKQTAPPPSIAPPPQKDELEKVNLNDYAPNPLSGLAGPTVSKNDKRKLRHLMWLQKLEVSKAAKEREAHSQRVAANPLQEKGGFGSLLEALPDLDLLKAHLQGTGAPSKTSKEGTKTATKKEKKQKVVSRTARQLTLAREAAQLTTIMGLGVYRQHPTAAIKQHIQNKVAAKLL